MRRKSVQTRAETTRSSLLISDGTRLDHWIPQIGAEGVVVGVVALALFYLSADMLIVLPSWFTGSYLGVLTIIAFVFLTRNAFRTEE